VQYGVMVDHQKKFKQLMVRPSEAAVQLQNCSYVKIGYSEKAQSIQTIF
jgi:hypothetical protein